MIGIRSVEFFHIRLNFHLVNGKRDLGLDGFSHLKSVVGTMVVGWLGLGVSHLKWFGSKK